MKIWFLRTYVRDLVKFFSFSYYFHFLLIIHVHGQNFCYSPNPGFASALTLKFKSGIRIKLIISCIDSKHFVHWDDYQEKNSNFLSFISGRYLLTFTLWSEISGLIWNMICSVCVVGLLCENFVTWGWDLTFNSNKQRLLDMIRDHSQLSSS